MLVHEKQGEEEKNSLHYNEILSKEEVIELAKRKEEGDKEAEEKLFFTHVSFVKFMVRPYKGRGIPDEDLEQEGYLALLQAIKTYDWRFGILLSSHASKYIIRNMQRLLIRSEMIRKPENLWREINKYQYTRNVLRSKLHHPPTDAEIAAEMGISLDRLYELKGRIYQYVSTDDTYSEPSDEPSENAYYHKKAPKRMPFVSANDSTEDQVFQKMGLMDLEGMEEYLSEKEEMVLSLRFTNEGKNMTFREISEVIGTTPEGARVIYKRAINKLSSYINEKKTEEIQTGF